MADYIVVKRDELYHHGIDGQKHGVRNGPPYPLGSRRSPYEKALARAHKENKRAKRKKDRVGPRHTVVNAKNKQRVQNAGKMAGKSLERNIKTKNGKISTAEDIGNNTKKAARGVNDLKRQSMRAKNDRETARIQNEASQLSDRELQQRINRLQMEQRYVNLSQPQVEVGSDRVSRFLDTSLTVLEITAAGVGIAAGIQTLRKGG